MKLYTKIATVTLHVTTCLLLSCFHAFACRCRFFRLAGALGAMGPSKKAGWGCPQALNPQTQNPQTLNIDICSINIYIYIYRCVAATAAIHACCLIECHGCGLAVASGHGCGLAIATEQAHGCGLVLCSQQGPNHGYGLVPLARGKATPWLRPGALPRSTRSPRLRPGALVGAQQAHGGLVLCCEESMPTAAAWCLPLSVSLSLSRCLYMRTPIYMCVYTCLKPYKP